MDSAPDKVKVTHHVMNVSGHNWHRLPVQDDVPGGQDSQAAALGHGRAGEVQVPHPLLHQGQHRGRGGVRHHQRQLFPPDQQVDRRREDREGQRRDHHVGGEQDRPLRQEAGLHRRGREKSKY